MFIPHSLKNLSVYQFLSVLYFLQQSVTQVKKGQCTGNIEGLLSRLHLQDKKTKMSPADLLKICPPVKQIHDTSEKDLARTFLQKLSMLDY